MSDRRRVGIRLAEGGEIQVCLHGDASPETIEALRQLGDAVAAKMRAGEPPFARCRRGGTHVYPRTGTRYDDGCCLKCGAAAREGKPA